MAYDLSPFQEAALDRYARDAERTEKGGQGRLMAVQSHASARSGLSNYQRALIDLVVVRGRSLSYVAALASGRTPGELHASLSEAATQLARHYEAQPA